VVSSTPRPHFSAGKDPVPILQEAGWATGPVWTGGKSRPHRDSIPDRPARSQWPDKEVEIKNITVYVSGYNETDTTGMLSPPTVWRQHSESVSSRQSGQTPAVVRMGFQCSYKYAHACRIKCRRRCLRCIPRETSVSCVVSVLAPV